jgi:hypothetical protein
MLIDMNLLPYDHFVLRTHLDPDQVRQRLREHVALPIWRPFPLIRGKEAFSGWINGYQFEVKRVKLNNNRFNAIVRGIIEPRIGGSQIAISIQPNTSAAVFMALWLGGVGAVGLMVAAVTVMKLVQASDLTTSDYDSLRHVGMMFVGGAVFLIGSYKFEAVRSRFFLEELLEANEPAAL